MRPLKRFATVSLAIFAAGALAGGVVVALLMNSRAPRVVELAAPRIVEAAPVRVLAAAAPRDSVSAAAAPAPEASISSPRTEPPALRAEAAPVEAPSDAVSGEKAIAKSPPHAPPAPGFDAPSCQQLLGDTLGKRRSRQAAIQETRLANRQLLLGNVVKAQVSYCKALAWDASNVDRHVNLARLFLIRRDWEKAAQSSRHALELDPKSRPALAALGDALAALEQNAQARAAWLAAEAKTRASPRELALIVGRNMALAARVGRLHDFGLAERLYRRVLLLHPDHVGATSGIATCLLKVGEYQAAQAWAHRAEQLKRGA